MKIKRNSSNLQSFIAILIVIVIFFSVCFLVLFGLSKIGVLTTPKFLRKTETREDNDNNQIKDIPLYITEINDGDISYENYKEILKYVPLQNSFYIQADIKLTDASYHYWIWKYNSMYKIATLDFDTYTALKTITCNGENVKIIDTQTGNVEYHKMNEGYTFLEQTPVINFTNLNDGNNVVNNIVVLDDSVKYYITLENNENIDFTINRDNYIPTEYKVYLNNTLIREFKLNSFEEVDYFSNDQFNIDK